MADHKVGAAATLLKDGELRRLDLDGTALVLARRGDAYYAVGGDCSHYGGPLDKGVLKDYALMCPWHHACFDIRSGARLEPPALNDVPHFPVRVEAGQVIVTLPQDNVTEPQGKADPADKRHFVIVGGGAAGSAAAEELRRSGYRGRITIISQTNTVPVDRPNLSKDYLAGHADPGWVPLRGDAQWYTDRGIELRLGTQVAGIDVKGHSVGIAGAESIRYDRLLLATGGTPRTLAVPGADLQGIYTLRELPDSDRIIEAAQKGKRAVIIGASFIGMEAAASLKAGRDVSVTVVGIENVPFERILGDEIGAMFQQEHQANGVQFRLSAEVKGFAGEKGHVTGVELKSGELLPADFVVLGVGVTPATAYLRDSGLDLNEKDRAVQVNAFLQTRDPDVFAAGDIARWDDGSARGVRIEHWRAAQQQGMVAARNMLDQRESMSRHIPFFWTVQWNLTLRYVGHAAQWDEIVYRYGTPAKKDFIAFYLANERLLAAAGMKHNADLDALEFILQGKQPLSKAEMRDTAFDLVAYASSGVMNH